MKGIRRFIGDRAFYRMVLAIMLPIMLQNGITNFVGLLDNIMIGRVGTDQMSGVSIANQLLLIFNLASIGGASAAGLFGAQFYGKGDHRGVRDVLRIKLWFSVIISVLGALVFTVFGRQILSLFLHEGGSTGNAEATLEYGMTYLMLARFLLFPFSVVQAYSSTLRETAKTVSPMRAGLIAVFVNLFFNWVLIFGKLGAPAMGVSGAILATIISRVVEAVLVISWTHRNSAINAFTEGLYESLRVPWDLVRSVIVKGWPLLLNEVVWSAGMATLSQCYSTRGLAVVAGYSIASTVNQLFNIIFISFGIAIGIIVGNLLGADKLEEARPVLSASLQYDRRSQTSRDGIHTYQRHADAMLRVRGRFVLYAPVRRKDADHVPVRRRVHVGRERPCRHDPRASDEPVRHYDLSLLESACADQNGIRRGSGPQGRLDQQYGQGRILTGAEASLKLPTCRMLNKRIKSILLI